MINIIKRDHHGVVKVQYPAEVVERGETWVCIRAPFSGTQDKDIGPAVFRPGDIFTEWHYSDRWYNIFRIEDGQSGELKGWYCNVTRPAVITQESVSADDLALDVFVFPTGEIKLLDEDEFAELELSVEEQAAAAEAVETIRRMVAGRTAPFRV